MIVRTKQITCLEDLDKVLKSSGLRIDECQIVPVVGKFKTNFYVYYDDGKPDPKAAKTEAAPAQDDTIDLSTGYTECLDNSNPSFRYILRNVITVEN